MYLLSESYKQLPFCFPSKYLQFLLPFPVPNPHKSSAEHPLGHFPNGNRDLYYLHPLHLMPQRYLLLWNWLQQFFLWQYLLSHFVLPLPEPQLLHQQNYSLLFPVLSARLKLQKYFPVQQPVQFVLKCLPNKATLQGLFSIYSFAFFSSPFLLIFKPIFYYT